MPLILPSNVPDPLAHISALYLQQGGPRLQNSAVNTTPPISALSLQLYVLTLNSSDVSAAAHTPPLSVLIQGWFRLPPPPSAVRTYAPLLSDFIPQQVEPPLKPSAVNPPPLPRILAFPLQRGVHPLQSLFVCDSPTLFSVLLQG